MSRKKTFFCVIFNLLLACSLSATIWAQGSELGSIEGTVTDKSGAVVPGVTVTVKNKATGFERVVVSEDNGYYRVPSLQAGKYTLTAELAGFSKFLVEETIVNVGTSTNVKVTLEPAGTQEVVTVSSVAALVDTSKTDVGGVVDNRAVENQPLNGRNFSSLALMIPGARPVGAWDPTKTRIGAISIAGAGGRNINTTIDGIDNKDNTVGGYVQNISIEAIQEFALKTQRFSAADGRSQGGLLSIVTKSGSNRFHGSWFSFFRNDKLNANDYFSKKQGASKPDFSRKQFGGSIGGPIAKDKAFFFFAIERLNEDQSLIVPPNSFKELSALKASGVSIYGAVPNPAQQIPTPFTNTLTTARLDFAFTEKNNAYLSWSENRDNTLNDQGTEDLTTNNFNKNKNELFSFVLNSVLSPTKLNQFTAGYSYWNNLIDSDNYSPITVSFANVTFGTNGNVPQQSYQVKWQLKDAFSWTAGNHGWKFGVDYVFEPKLGGFFKFTPVPSLTFFD
ncbi:MAG TPA: carboxypeptidase-like regulatory domain-containing protein, partial [Acidobacteriota bacterium]|nr:carboxypeptidase-like regulatory domain-containing protein [Acidobacteriota bacterium]